MRNWSTLLKKPRWHTASRRRKSALTCSLEANIYAPTGGPADWRLLKLPVINAVSHIQRDGDKIIVERTLEETLKLSGSRAARGAAATQILTFHASRQ